MSLFNKDGRINLLSKTRLVLGRFDPEIVDYDNVRTFKFKVREGIDLHVKVGSNVPVDVAIFDSEGAVVRSNTNIQNGEIEPVHFEEKENVMLAVAVYRGDLGEIDLDIWQE